MYTNKILDKFSPQKSHYNLDKADSVSFL